MRTRNNENIPQPKVAQLFSFGEATIREEEEEEQRLSNGCEDTLAQERDIKFWGEREEEKQTNSLLPFNRACCKAFNASPQLLWP